MGVTVMHLKRSFEGAMFVSGVVVGLVSVSGCQFVIFEVLAGRV